MKNRIKTLIVEDDLEIQHYLTELIEASYVEFELIQGCGSVTEAIDQIKEQKPELILMDIELEGGDAFDILDRFPNPTFDIIFITAHGKYMENAFNYFAFNFLVKPIATAELKRVLTSLLIKKERTFEKYRYEILRDFIKKNNSRFLLNLGDKNLVINLNEVMYCKADGNYTQFSFKSGEKQLASNALLFYEKILGDRDFFRINRFYLLNLKNVQYIHKKETIILKDQTKISVTARSKGRLDELMKRI